MNHYEQLNTKVINLSTFGLEEMLELQLKKLGLDHFVLMIIDQHQQPVFQQVSGFSEQQMHVYEANMAHDVFFQHYSHNGYLGQLVYMQDMLPMRHIRDPIFNDILVPTMQLYHSYSGLTPLVQNHYLMLSSHGDNRLSYRANKDAQNIWHFVTSWGNYWIAQRAMLMELRRFKDAPQNTLSLASLTNAELSVLNMLAQGMDGSEVAMRRNVSKETVRSQVKCILHKTGCRHQNQLIARYLRSGKHYSADLMTLSTSLTSLI